MRKGWGNYFKTKFLRVSTANSGVHVVTVCKVTEDKCPEWRLDGSLKIDSDASRLAKEELDQQTFKDLLGFFGSKEI